MYFCRIFYCIAVLLLLIIKTMAYAECSSAIKSLYSELLLDYQEHMLEHPTQYTLLSKKNDGFVEIRKYQLISQNWSPQNLVSPAQWKHIVEIVIPQKPYLNRAVVIISNGINNNIDNKPPVEPKDSTRLKTLAQATNTIIISVSDIPNQYLMFKPDGKPYKEDGAVACSWSLFLNNPKEQYMLPLQIPMTTAVSQALTLAQQELRTWNIERFIVTGTSKRGLTSWLVALTDARVDAIVPFVYDMLNTQKNLDHMYHTYGGNWPIAFHPYYQQNIQGFLGTKPFNKLMQIVDPIQYLKNNKGYPLNIPKYIVNASGDDFFTPDNISYYYEELPEIKTLRIVPNSSHYGINGYIESSLIPFIHRVQKNKELPQIKTEHTGENLLLTFSEKPKILKLWTAKNPRARDFRYACGIRFHSKKVNYRKQLRIPLTYPKKGWQAAFIEATFDDGFVVTTPVYITPNQYPEQAPPFGKDKDSVCKTLPGKINK